MPDAFWPVLGVGIGLLFGILLTRAWARRYLRCMHHNPKGGWVADEPDKATSWVGAELTDVGMGKAFRCRRCGKEWKV